MNKKSKIYIAVSVIICIIIVVALVSVYFYQKRLTTNDPNTNTNGKNTILNDSEEYVEILEDGTKINNNEKLKENKKIDKLDITDINITASNGLTKLTGTITNNTNEIQEESVISIIFLDKDGNELTKVGAYIKQLAPEESTQLNASVIFDYSNVYDIKFEKQE